MPILSVTSRGETVSNVSIVSDGSKRVRVRAPDGIVSRGISIFSSATVAQVIVAAAALIGLFGVAAPRAAAAAPVPAAAWSVRAVPAPTVFMPGDPREEFLQIYVTNIGSRPTDGAPITINDALSGTGVHAVELEGADAKTSEALSCSITPLECSDPAGMAPGDILHLYLGVQTDTSAEGIATNAVTVSGGGAATVTESSTVPISSTVQQPFGITDFTFDATGLSGLPETQAGGHPYAVSTTLDFSTQHNPRVPGETTQEADETAESLKDVVVDLPPGLVGNALSAPRCPVAQLELKESNEWQCPADTIIGEVTLREAFAGRRIISSVAGNESAQPVSPIYNFVPEPGHPAEFGFADSIVARVHLFPSLVRTSAGYVVRVTVPNNLSELGPGQTGLIDGSTLTFFGDPGVQDASGSAPIPFFTNPVDCTAGPLVITTHVDTWGRPGRTNSEGMPDFSDPNWLEATKTLPPVIGCEALKFIPTLAFLPDTTQADAPAGATVSLNLPQAPVSDAVPATPELKDATVSLPRGVVISPSAANGLQACSDEQFAASANNPATCPQASQIGTVRVHTPILAEVLEGQVFLGTPQCSPCGNADAQSGDLARLFVQVHSDQYGITIKIPGSVSIDPTTGQLTATFRNDPQQPFDDLKLEFPQGPRATLATPSACGTYTTTSDLTPWSAPFTPDATPASSFQINEGCGPQGFAPSFTAGTANPQAGGYSPFTLMFSRNDGEQDLGGLEQTLPPGLLARLAGVQQCGSPEAAAGNCPAGSRIGSVTVAVGPGTEPFVTHGAAYLTGPYNGGPFGVAVEVPTTAGPFTLAPLHGSGGVEVLRNAIRINPNTAQATVVSDPFPTMLAGIPLQIRTVNVTLDRPAFTFNATSCAEKSISGILSGTGGAAADVSSRYEAGNCASLPFKPVFSASTDGHTSKLDGASLHIKITSGGIGVANIAKVDLTIPNVLPSRLETIQKACTEQQFNTNPAGCPAASNIATATVHTPLLNSPLSGPVYFVSHGGAAFPDTEVILQGEGITLVLDGHTQITKGVTYSRFESVPDAPFTSFEFNAPEGRYSIFGANANLCQTATHMPTRIVGQNGAVLEQSTLVQPEGCPNKITIVSKKTKGRNLTLRVAVPAAGKLTATGKGLRKATKTSTGRSTITLTINVNRRHKRSTKIKLNFTPGKGRPLTTMVAAKFKAS